MDINYLRVVRVFPFIQHSNETLNEDNSFSKLYLVKRICGRMLILCQMSTKTHRTGSVKNHFCQKKDMTDCLPYILPKSHPYFHIFWEEVITNLQIIFSKVYENDYDYVNNKILHNELSTKTGNTFHFVF